MNFEQARAAADHEVIAELIGIPFGNWAHQCHAISLAVVRTGIFGEGRVARGFCKGVPRQHSWIVLGWDVYDVHAVVVDPTLCFNNPAISGIFVTRNLDEHRPHGLGSILDYGRPAPPSLDPIELAPSFELSREARIFLDLLGPLDILGWGVLANSPVQGWPAAEIIAAMDDTPRLKARVPIDRLGMLTDRNPGKLYF